MIFQHDHEIDPELQRLHDWRKSRFRILVCIDGSEESYVGVRYAREIAKNKECDIILLYVRPIDQGLRTGGLQVRIARQNMLEWGLELPGIQYLKQGLAMLVDEDALTEDWKVHSDHADVWGDPLGDNKIEYRHTNGQSIVLKLKTAPEPASGILDQYELGPYNLMIFGAPSNWRAEWNSFWGASVVQKVTKVSPCSVLIARQQENNSAGQRGHLICTNGSAHSLDAACREAVLAHHCNHPVTLFSAAPTEKDKTNAEHAIQDAKAMLAELGVKVHDTIIRVGDPQTAILETGRNFDIIAVSGSSENRLKRFIYGSLSSNVMGQATASVLDVH